MLITEKPTIDPRSCLANLHLNLSLYLVYQVRLYILPCMFTFLSESNQAVTSYSNLESRFQIEKHIHATDSVNNNGLILLKISLLIRKEGGEFAAIYLAAGYIACLLLEEKYLFIRVVHFSFNSKTVPRMLVAIACLITGIAF
ncbi:hypothetical protein ACJX0J_042188 [Zea mays]